MLNSRVAFITLVAAILGIAAGGVAQLLIRIIGFITNLCFFGRVSTQFVTPAGNHLGAAVILIPVLGGLLIGIMARFGSKKIRGHGIPEAMEQVLYNESRIPVRMTLLKPISAAISIGTGGPFGAEGPIIATGGALGSLFGQLLEITASERKTLLAAGAAAGLTATFGNPISSVLLAIELLLFEFSSRSILPVAMACSAAAAVRIAFMGSGPAFDISALPTSGAAALAVYVAIGAIIGVAAVWITELISWLEHQFARIPGPWLFHPAIGGLVVGLVGWKLPHTMGPGYDTIENILTGKIGGGALLFFFVFKLISWSSSVGSGTSGGTLAPMFAMGGCLGGAIAGGVAYLFPQLGVSPQVAALVGMAAIFAGASRALLASVVLTFETTHQFEGALPLLAGCAAAHLVSGLLMKHTIMTERFIREGRTVPEEYIPDPLTHIQAGQAARTPLMITRYEKARLSLRPPRRKLVVITAHSSLQEALALMLKERVGRLLVISKESPLHILTRTDIHRSYQKSLRAAEQRERVLQLFKRPSQAS